MPSSIFYSSFTHTYTSEASLSPLDLEKIDPNNSKPAGDVLLSAAMSLLHDHSAVITLNPLVTSNVPLENTDPPPGASNFSPSSTPWQAYNITDTKSVLFNLGSTSMTYRAWLRNSDRGYDSIVAAPAGVAIEASWVAEIMEGPDGDASQGASKVKLTETAKVTCSRVFSAFIKSTLSGSHSEMHDRFWERCKERIGKT
ncbi:MAG: hypothetical protein Q9160_003518 [Pyrenula sp. 1 TL-2023]